ncbi:DUF294 nucleotidyltransferase-like domain-containing protein [Alteromonas sp. ASW11-130]|uniref:DUF294 nucleotidyltransferase-like domain-containing protein n=1 Tax=Alteromonas sp. ASW11-130 TaxID=3015775 RepID=UPI0022422B6E|nr:DUF294 nucleotidyltransferase-like domain-containing protein [Alteromonas sp. ASW11-130]MCW8090226.1 DUF294 nucleotidyltransferase-like domain-containing protein [Alteromonas sp. ASW11-130]
MQADFPELLEFLLRHPPFDALPEDAFDGLNEHVEIAYFKKGTDILKLGEHIDKWCVIRQGAVEIFRRNGSLHNRLSTGGFFGELSLLQGKPVRFPVKALEDTLLYLISAEKFHYLFDNYDSFADFVEVEDRRRLRHAVQKSENIQNLLTAKVSDLLGEKLEPVSPQTTVQEAATFMCEHNTSSVLVKGDVDDRKVVGILTDADIRAKIVSKGLPLTTRVYEAMQSDFPSITTDRFVYEAMMSMLKNNVQHLVVLPKSSPAELPSTLSSHSDSGQTSSLSPEGIISNVDLIRYESRNSLFVVSSIFEADSVEALAALREDVVASFLRMVNEDANSTMIGGALAAIGRSFKQRLLELAEIKLGPPPIPYCFIALGSMAREEQLLVTDQDNGIILDNRFEEDVHDAYFADLARFVCDGLHQCGYPYCKGNIMATNKKWRQPYRQWQRYFIDWIEHPTPESLLHSNIFFDLDGVFGRTEWAEELNRLILHKAYKHPLFLASMTRNALRRTPPLGFFKDFVMESDGRHSNSIDMKKRGTSPISDLVRIHALEIGSTSANTNARLQDVIQSNILPNGRGEDLRDAMELIAMVRIRHQAVDVEQGIEPDNNIEPDNLSEFERKHLKDAFEVVTNAQRYLRFRYQAGRQFTRDAAPSVTR